MLSVDRHPSNPCAERPGGMRELPLLTGRTIMNKYIITAREIERMLNLAAMEEAGCLSRAGKEELNELVARVQ